MPFRFHRPQRAAAPEKRRIFDHCLKTFETTLQSAIGNGGGGYGARDDDDDAGSIALSGGVGGGGGDAAASGGGGGKGKGKLKAAETRSLRMRLLVDAPQAFESALRETTLRGDVVRDVQDILDQVGSITFAFCQSLFIPSFLSSFLTSPRRFTHARFCQSLLAFATKHSTLYFFVPFLTPVCIGAGWKF
jgi:hypothetical protein